MQRAWVLLGLIACGGNKSSPDAAVVPIDAPACARTVFVNFGGATVKSGAQDSATETSDIVGSTPPYTVPVFLAGQADRDTQIATITSDASAILAPYAYQIVTTRPAAEPYQEIVFGHDASQIGVTATVTSLATQTCTTGIVPNAVSFVFQTVGGTPLTNLQLGNQIVFVTGIMNDVPASTTINDCEDVSHLDSVTCTIGGPTTARSTNQNCGSGATFDEAGAFMAGTGCP